MTEPTSIDGFIKAWAVIGPLVGAGVSAWWSRRNQVIDRVHEQSVEERRQERAEAASNIEHQRALRSAKYNEVKNAIAEFMASSSEYIRKRSDVMTNHSDSKERASIEATDRFTNSFHLVVLLGDEALADKAINLWNVAWGMPRAYNNPPDKPYQDLLAKHRAARAELNADARRYLATLEAGNAGEEGRESRR